MSVALIGLMVIQVYWIKNAVTVKEATFIRSVNDAITSVVFKLERIEAANQFRNRSNYLQQRQNWLNSIDSVNRALVDYGSVSEQQMEMEKFLQKSFIAQDALAGMMNDLSNQPIENRLDYYVLDSLISFELTGRGINTEFEFGVFSPLRNLMPIQRTGKYPKELLNKGFSFALFPSDMFANPDYLMVFFPNEKRFLVSQLWQTLTVSIVFIIIIILSFSYTVMTILRQKKLSEMKNDFINNMTHEFKTPISTISLACQALGDKDIVKSETLFNNYISVIDEENNRLGKMAERVLQSAVLEKGEINLKMEELNLHEIIINAIQKIKLQIEKKEGKIFTQLNAEKHLINADKVHLTNVILNLLENANKYSPKYPQITISTENSYSGVIISIADKGSGISKSNQKKIFDKLFRVPTGNVHNVKGFGLGLNYVKTIIDRLEGKIAVESEVNKGSKFIITLPQ